MLGLFYISIATFIIVAIITVIKCWGESGSYIFDIGFSLLLATLISFLMIGFLIFCSQFPDTENGNPTKIDIYAIKDNSEVQGRFSLGYGTVNEKQYFYYVVKRNDGFKYISKAKVENSMIKEGNYDNPYILKYEKEYVSKFARFMYGKGSGEYVYHFFVPHNTITTEYKIDLE